MVMLMRGREFASKARTKKIIADRARQKILLPVPVLAGKNFGAKVTGPNFFLRTGSVGNFLAGATRCGLTFACDGAGPGLWGVDGPGAGGRGHR